MKRIVFLVLSVCLYGDVSFELNIIKDIERYNPPLVKIVNYNLFNFYKDKNIVHKKNYFVKKQINIKIEAIFNDKVYINGKWYKKGDKVFSYIIYKIYPNKIILRQNKRFKSVEFLRNNLLKVVQ